MYYAIPTMKSQGKLKKILFVITQGTWGGAQRYVFDLAKTLAHTYEVIIAIGEPNGSKDLQNTLENMAHSKIEVIQLNHLVRRISLIHDLLAILELARLYRKIEPSIVHLNSTKAGILGSFAKRCLPKNFSTRIVYTVHGWVFLEPLPRIIQCLYTYLEKNTARFKDAIIVLSNKEKHVASTTLNIPQQKLSLIPLGIDSFSVFSSIDARKQLAKKLPTHLDEDIPWVGTIAGLYKTKGLDFLIQTAQDMKKKDMPLPFFFIIGEGRERKSLEQMIQNAHLEKNIFLLGYKQNAAQFLSAFDVFLLPSRKEGSPYVLLEAMHAGTPIIATDVGGVREILSPYKNGSIIPFGDIQQLSKILIMKLKQSRSRVDNIPLLEFSLQTTVHATLQVYSSLTQD